MQININLVHFQSNISLHAIALNSDDSETGSFDHDRVLLIIIHCISDHWGLVNTHISQLNILSFLSCKQNISFPSDCFGGNSSIFIRNLAILIPKSLVCTHSPCSASCPSVFTWHCIDSLNSFLLLRTTPCSTYGHHQRYLAPVPSPLVHASNN